VSGADAAPETFREVERKLRVHALYRLPDLTALASAGIAEALPGPSLALDATYYDTGDLRLARGRATLRRRKGGGDDGWHLKLPSDDGAAGARDEIRLPLDDSDSPPEALLQLVLGITRGTAVEPVATLHTERRPIDLVAADGLHSSIRRACTLDAPPARHPRFGLRRHYRIAPWTDLVEVYWSLGAEAYVTPVADDLVGVAVLGASSGDFDSRLAAFPALRERLAAAEPVGGVRGAGPLRQNVRHRVCASVLLVGDASGYIDALTGEGISVSLAQAAALVECLQAGRVADYEYAWRRVSRKSRLLTTGLLWSRHSSLLAPRIVPAAQYLPRLFTSIVNHVAAA